MTPPIDHPEEKEELPPFFKTWNGMYIAVLANLVFLMLFFYGFTKYFE